MDERLRQERHKTAGWARIERRALFRRAADVESLTRHEAGRLTDGKVAHGQQRETQMQDGNHRQSPILGLVALDGEGKSVEELDDECREAFLEVAERQLDALAGSRSRWRAFAALIAEECAPHETASRVRAV